CCSTSASIRRKSPMPWVSRRDRSSAPTRAYSPAYVARSLAPRARGRLPPPPVSAGRPEGDLPRGPRLGPGPADAHVFRRQTRRHHGGVGRAAWRATAPRAAGSRAAVGAVPRGDPLLGLPRRPPLASHRLRTGVRARRFLMARRTRSLSAGG